MRPPATQYLLFALAAGAVLGGWYFVSEPPPAPKPPREALLALTGVAPVADAGVRDWAYRTRPMQVEPAPGESPAPEAVKAAAAPPKPGPAPTLLQLGDETTFKRVALTTRGGAVQQVILNTFDEANALGREVKTADGKPQKLHLIPGVVRPNYLGRLTDIHARPDLGRVPTLPPGEVTDADLRATLAEPSYQLLHYPAQDDPARQPDDAGKMNDTYPSPELAQRDWVVIESSPGKAVFETELGAPYFLKLRKTYTLPAKTYHVEFQLDVVALPGRQAGKGAFRYQIAGARGLPIEGEWYSTTYRNVLAGWTTPYGGQRRSYDDAMSIHARAGGDRVNRSDNAFNYAAVATQYFTSALAVEENQPQPVRQRIWDYVRATREPRAGDDPQQLFFADVTARAVAAPLDPAAGETVTHKYLIYNGPAKVSLLKQLGGDRAVDPALVARYADSIGLRTIADYHSPNFFGRLANSIWWSDLVITMTNLMHSVLGFLHGIVPVWGINIVMLTVCVRLMLFGPSRKQQMAMAKMQAQMTALKPEIDKLQERYKNDAQAFNQARTRLMLENGVNPLSTMGGCLMLFAQMPILMGLYFCLQESIFFRLESFLWIDNLAAPDMLKWWSEKVPFLSTPDGIGGMTYLGPYFNVLPLISVILIFIHQSITLPPPTDEMQRQQQVMMKFMVGMMAIFFYKVPAGLCIYFICGTLWALAERKFIPKPQVGEIKLRTKDDAQGRSPVGGATPPAQRGGLIGRLQRRMEEMQKQYDEQTKRQIRNEPPGPGRPNAGGRGGPPPAPPSGNRDERRRRKK